MGQLRWHRCLVVMAVTISKGGTDRWDVQEWYRKMGKSPLCSSEQASSYLSTKRTCITLLFSPFPHYSFFPLVPFLLSLSFLPYPVKLSVPWMGFFFHASCLLQYCSDDVQVVKKKTVCGFFTLGATCRCVAGPS